MRPTDQAGDVSHEKTVYYIQFPRGETFMVYRVSWESTWVIQEAEEKRGNDVPEPS